MRAKTIYEDKQIWVVWKPAGLATQSAGVGQPDLVSELKKDLVSRKQEPYVAVVHRLDQPVEGLLVFAKTKQAAAFLSKQLGEAGLNKQYYAVVCGQPSDKEATLVDYLRKGKDSRAEVLSEEAARGTDAKKALLRYRVTERTAVPGLALLDVQIETGRFHQIRAQLSHAGYPLLGDAKYGTEETKCLARELGVRNVALCAYKLSLIHPVTGQKMSFESRPENVAFDRFAENNFGCDCIY